MLLSEAFTLSLQRVVQDQDSMLPERRCNDSVKASLSGTLIQALGLRGHQGARSNAAALKANEGTRRIATAEQTDAADGETTASFLRVQRAAADPYR